VTIARRVRGSWTVARRIRAERRVPYLPRERVEALRDARVRDVVAYAAASVPFYRDLFRELDAAPGDFRTAAELALLPPVGKETVQADPERFRSGSAAGRDAVAFLTSGSTGLPLRVYHDRGSLLGNVAASVRERDVEARLAGRRRYRTLALNHETSTGRQARSETRRLVAAPLRPPRMTLSVDEPLDAVAAALDRFRPHVLKSYGAYLETLLHALAERTPRPHIPPVAVYGGDTLGRDRRRDIEEALGISLISRYNAVEAFKIGFFCEERCGFHVHEDLCHVRIVDEAGRDVEPGRPGEVVISNLVNRGTVLLNYRLGDAASLTTDPCGCGRTLAVLPEVEGRVDEILRLPGGRIVAPISVWDAVKRRPGVERFQLVQTAPAGFELRLVTSGSDAFELAAPAIAADLSRLLGATVVPARVAGLDGGPRGKFRLVVPIGSAGAGA
jgi:phenylacetate-CoA ligase